LDSRLKYKKKKMALGVFDLRGGWGGHGVDATYGG